MPLQSPLRLVALPGSLRRESISLAVLRTLAERAPAGIEIELHALHDVPLYNGDDDTETPPASVAALRAMIERSDGIIVGTPEYNHGVTGVLKNALDWASRPRASSSLQGKPALIVTWSPRAYGQVEATLTGARARPSARGQLNFNFANDKVKDGRLVDEPALEVLLPALNDFAAEIRMVAGR